MYSCTYVGLYSTNVAYINKTRVNISVINSKHPQHQLQVLTNNTRQYGSATSMYSEALESTQTSCSILIISNDNCIISNDNRQCTKSCGSAIIRVLHMLDNYACTYHNACHYTTSLLSINTTTIQTYNYNHLCTYS